MRRIFRREWYRRERVFPIDAEFQVDDPDVFPVTLESRGGLAVSDGQMLVVTPVQVQSTLRERALTMLDRVFTAEQLLPVPRDAAFAFFSEPRNLEAITPPWLRFRIIGQSAAQLKEGTELTYRLRIHGLAVTWHSRIDEWRPNERFVDVQLKGPYARWHHTHSFHDRGRATLIRDRVLYRLPLGRLGHWVGGRFVATDVKKIFEYRAARTAELLRALERDAP